MSAFRRSSSAALLALWAGLAAAETAPARVVSMNLCTDQLALLLGAPGQVISVSALAQDPMSSAMAAEAAELPANHGQAEEIFLMHPDLVLAGSFTTRATVELLRRLGLRVEEIDPAYSLDDIRADILAVGHALGRDAAAADLVARFDTDLARLTGETVRRPAAALYYANGYTSGPASLAGEILSAAGFDNVAARAGLVRGGILPLELLILARPEAVLTGRPYPGASRAEEILAHPALLALRGRAAFANIDDPDWICGTPAVLRAIAGLAEIRRGLE